MAISPAPSEGRLTPPAADCDLSGEWQVELNQSGGLAGVQSRLIIDSNGSYVAEDLRQRRRVDGAVTSEALQQVLDLLPAICEPRQMGRLPVCADCFTYALRLRVSEAEYAATLNDLSPADSPLGSLARLLSRLLAEAL
jgi:hypothetical protein